MAAAWYGVIETHHRRAAAYARSKISWQHAAYNQKYWVGAKWRSRRYGIVLGMLLISERGASKTIITIARNIIIIEIMRSEMS